ncbi:MAG TPA: hypothetical protein VF959_04575, partial [Casimicrobiaceae bacterium]
AASKDQALHAAGEQQDDLRLRLDAETQNALQLRQEVIVATRREDQLREELAARDEQISMLLFAIEDYRRIEGTGIGRIATWLYRRHAREQ